ncbi:hypothetical protein [Chryseobacterium cheonjiense]|uniref:Uncharacterized protein n=1 Tax=Chryseobacterium cheonjiense TaxID=2728845 RepID=A0A7Y0A4W6_9FLAO|nr:hypothetical protein [Chryseobacterium cheonjiense]NML56717.1 hypothetical protein [Chryseobacterium cheonjiense]
MRRIIILIITSINCIFCSSQTKINKSKEIDILIKMPIHLNSQEPVKFTIQNKSNNSYIIDPYGFAGESYWLFENKRLNSLGLEKGYYSRENVDCQNDIIIIKPKERIQTTINLNYSEIHRYDFSKSGHYIWKVESKHDRENAMPASCRQYINELEIKGYHFLNDSIVANIPFVK